MIDFNFKIERELPNGLGRAGKIETAHGVIETPAFIVVGTKATVKALTPEQVRDLGAQAVLANTYHLYLQPGADLVAEAGGLQKFMNWRGPTFTDSGGFQVFSLGAAYGEGGLTKFAVGDKSKNPYLSRLDIEKTEEVVKLAKIDNEGVTFRSHLDGSEHRLTPEKSMQIQHQLGADIIFAFDECTAPSADYEYQKEALARTHAWAERSLAEHQKLGGSQSLFGIVQGGRHEDLRQESAQFIGSLPFAGFGIGGSFDKDDMGTAVCWVCENLPKDKPRHLLGIGAVEDIFTGIENGADTFDCVAPTREARNGSLYTSSGRINISNAQYKKDFTPIEKGCDCYTCQHFTRAYLDHLFRAKEMQAGTLASIHNLYFFVNLVKKIRQSILDENFTEFKKVFLEKFKNG
ncbi:MAG: Queuine tRNA-ribosyltransferase [Parcubacteria group bacterium GW2011_GWC1_43_11b]|nr:MAG: Queuine tRNA-ribosyltransferase [Parcubacteria group bacterium GW2011_GWC1_43_11b]KKT08641.1 MAG: Queuine tRNA-ribosyltransferase [Parcubacteria group bacterium GW2011_GWA1_43_21]